LIEPQQDIKNIYSGMAFHPINIQRNNIEVRYSEDLRE